LARDSTISEIEESGRRIGREFEAERVILFGSYAKGTVTEDSDVDLLVVSRYRSCSKRTLHRCWPMNSVRLMLES
jgi:predicted nucleotidyltransferase